MARPKVHDTRKIVCLPQGVVEQIDNFRFEKRIKTEAEAIRRLIAAGLDAESAKAEAPDAA